MSKSTILVGLGVLLSVTVTSAQTTAADIEGTPYLEETYVQGEVQFGKTVSVLPIRYNIFQDLMEYKQNGQVLVFDPTTKIKKVHFGNQTFIVDKFELKGKTKYGFLTMLDSGKAMLVSKHVVTYLGAKKGGNLDGSDTPARYARSADVYFYKIGTGNLIRVENLKSLIAGFADKQEELTKFAKEEKISVKKENELVRLFKYYNSLQGETLVQK